MFTIYSVVSGIHFHRCFEVLFASQDYVNIVCVCLLVSLLFCTRLLKFVILQHLLVSILKHSAFA